jgi:hypothetical protein
MTVAILLLLCTGSVGCDPKEPIAIFTTREACLIYAAQYDGRDRIQWKCTATAIQRDDAGDELE